MARSQAQEELVGRIQETFQRTRQAGRIALMPYLPVGYPDVETTLALASALAGAGADMFELGIPFSDPLADGATLQHATHAAIQNGVTPRACLEVAAKIRQRQETPLLLMSYYNPIARFGTAGFCRAAIEAGVDGLIVPDLPPEEATELRMITQDCGLDLIFFAAPTSTDARLQRVGQIASGFVYCVALAGITGARGHLSDSLPEYLTRVGRYVQVPRVVGFGISRPEHIRTVAQSAEGAIVASALIDLLDRLPPQARIAGAAAYIADLAAATAVPG